MVKQKKATDDIRLTAPDYILGLDMSLEHTGYCLYNVKTGEKKQGLIEPGGKIKGMQRLDFLRRNVICLAQFGKLSEEVMIGNNPPMISCLVLIEHYAFGARGQAMISLGELGGVIRLAFYNQGIAYIEVPPTVAKKFVTSKGNCNKNLVLLEMYKRFGEDLTDDNVADATGLMYLGRAITDTYDKPLLSFQAAVAADVVKSYFKEHPVNAATV
jgi:Holliday junction resolvasome RuvABC endonuclease subunit